MSNAEQTVRAYRYVKSLAWKVPVLCSIGPISFLAGSFVGNTGLNWVIAIVSMFIYGAIALSVAAGDTYYSLWEYTRDQAFPNERKAAAELLERAQVDLRNAQERVAQHAKVLEGG